MRGGSGGVTTVGLVIGTLVDVLRSRGEQQPDKLAFEFLADVPGRASGIDARARPGCR